MIVDDDGVEYADNKVSRAMYAASKAFVPKWCQSEDHWTVTVLDYFWTDCSCCLFYRGLLVGGVTGAVIGLGAGLIF